MTAALDLSAGERVLEVGTGSGYQAAILSRLAADVVTVEWVPELAARARAALEELGATNVTVVNGDGTADFVGGPFDAVLVAAGAPGCRRYSATGSPTEADSSCRSARPSCRP